MTLMTIVLPEPVEEKVSFLFESKTFIFSGVVL